MRGLSIGADPTLSFVVQRVEHATRGRWAAWRHLCARGRSDCGGDRVLRVREGLGSDPRPPCHEKTRGQRVRAAPSAPGRTRTCDPRLRRPPLYPAELRGRAVCRVRALGGNQDRGTAVRSRKSRLALAALTSEHSRARRARARPRCRSPATTACRRPWRPDDPQHVAAARGRHQRPTERSYTVQVIGPNGDLGISATCLSSPTPRTVTTRATASTRSTSRSTRRCAAPTRRRPAR